jgi:hypothetical protein
MTVPGVIHQGLLTKICEKLPGPKRTGFWAALRALDHQYNFPDYIDIALGEPPLTDEDSTFWFTPHSHRGLLPDCWYVTHNDPFPGQATIHAVEIEDEVRIDNHRLEKYAHLWMDLDGTDSLILRLHTYDRYGRENPERDLNEWYCDFLHRPSGMLVNPWMIGGRTMDERQDLWGHPAMVNNQHKKWVNP